MLNKQLYLQMESEPKGKHSLALLCSPPYTHDGHTFTQAGTPGHVQRTGMCHVVA